MIRIAEKELVVNQQMRMQLECESSETELFVFDPEWGEEHVDPITGLLAEFYDHVPRNIKFAGGIQVWIRVPRYKLADGSCMFRVLPKNLSEFKHYAIEVIQDEIDIEVEELLSEETVTDEIEEQLNGDNDAEERPCERTKWLWLVWFIKNLLLIETVLRMIHLTSASVSAAGESELEEILQHSDYLLELRTNQPEDWLKIATQAAWNSGRPLIPLRDTQSLQEARKWITVHSISE